MIDVSPKFPTLRYAMAEAVFSCPPEVIRKIKEKSVPKGDVLEVARAAGITSAKRTADWIVFCHPIPLDWVEVQFEVGEAEVRVVAEVRSVWKTGVEMEAMSAVTGALLNMYDMLKPLESSLSFGEVRVVKKSGGKTQFTEVMPVALKTAVLVISDSTHAGQREDRSGKVIREFLAQQPVAVETYDVLPDDEEKIRNRVTKLVDDQGVRLIFTTGGTGLGPKDLTPEALRPLLDKEVPGIAEAMRKHGRERTPYAMLSREIVGVRGDSLIITLPGSSSGARESLEALFPGLLHAFPMMAGGGHDTKPGESPK